MNREIKFRSQRVDNREWVTGDLCKSISGAPCIMPTAFFATREFEQQEDNEPQVISDSLAIGGFYPVKPETVGQYTGLRDKNGVEIFEGDVVRFNVESRPEVEGEERVTGLIGKVEIGKYCTTFGVWQAVYCSSIIVVGNIHSNPELLK